LEVVIEVELLVELPLVEPLLAELLVELPLAEPLVVEL
tara:strand:- start:1064 stop:1177 length:114 start_codon:yes stop_codon:yes gene_type:complete